MTLGVPGLDSTRAVYQAHSHFVSNADVMDTIAMPRRNKMEDRLGLILYMIRINRIYWKIAATKVGNGLNIIVSLSPQHLNLPLCDSEGDTNAVSNTGQGRGGDVP